MNDPDLNTIVEVDDAATRNRLGEELLRSAPGEFSPIPRADWSIENLHQRLVWVDRWADECCELHWEALYREHEQELAELRLALRARELGADVVARERADARHRQLEKAFQYFEKSARLGDPEGMWNCGWRYFLGEGVDKDVQRGVTYWREAAARGHSGAHEKIEQLGMCT